MWRIGRTSSLILQSIDLDIDDNEIIISESGASRIAKIFNNNLGDQIHLINDEKFHCFYEKIELDGVNLEIEADLLVKLNGTTSKRVLGLFRLITYQSIFSSHATP
ncbi:MAG: hypothetical protein JW891_03555 [Candidatus Lokiarchaeota archaeon]|nr:hypothetical protein [Candidatus Lokiarchaeota archaeon]